MAPNEHLLNELCGQPEIKDLALSLLRKANTKTGPGSGYEVGAHKVGLPAICAYIASQKLNSNDVKQDVAQKASCLDKKIFAKVLGIVQAALGEDQRKVQKDVTYSSLYKEYRVEMPFRRLEPLFEDAKNSFIMLNNQHMKHGESAEVRCAIFYWICYLLKCNIPEIEIFAEENVIQPRWLKKMFKLLDTKCAAVKERVLESASKATSPKKEPFVVLPSPTKRSPRKFPLRELPSKDTPKKQRLDTAATPPVSPSKDSPKRRLLEASRPDLHDPADSLSLPETPVKKRRLDSPSKARIPSTPSNISRVTFDENPKQIQTRSITTPKVPTPSRPQRQRQRQRQPLPDPKPVANTDDAMDVDNADAELLFLEEEEERPPRRFRPVFLDYKQWSAPDPRLRRVWKQAEKHKTRMVEQYGYPLKQLLLAGA